MYDHVCQIKGPGVRNEVVPGLYSDAFGALRCIASLYATNTAVQNVAILRFGQRYARVRAQHSVVDTQHALGASCSAVDDIRSDCSVDSRPSPCGVAFESDRNACVVSRDKLLMLAPPWRSQQEVGIVARERDTNEVTELKLPSAAQLGASHVFEVCKSIQWRHVCARFDMRMA
eukprot:2043369-Pleurochrysis_carterae.AAC.1